MKLKSIRIRMFRNILDSTDVLLQPDVTCLVGKNESGKTAVLQAIWRLLPARGDPKFSAPDHYPAWLEKRDRNAGVQIEGVRPIEATFIVNDQIVEEVAELFGQGVIKAGSDLKVWRDYAGDTTCPSGHDDQRKFTA